MPDFPLNTVAKKCASKRALRALNVGLAAVLSTVLASTVSGCKPPTSRAALTAEPLVGAQPTELPQRIVSLDFCSDQYVLKLVDRQHILALSPDAEKPHSYLRDQAAGLPTVRAVAESVIALEPDLVVRAYGGGPGISHFLSRAGVPVLNIGWTGDVDGIKRVTQETAAGLGVPERGQAIVTELESRIAALPYTESSRQVLYMTPSGTTTGPGSLVHDLMVTAGLSNFLTEPGWRSLPLERLAYQSPDMIAAAFFDTNAQSSSAWSVMRHPVAREQLSEHPTVYLNGAWMSCGAWFAIDAIESLATQALTP